MQDKVPIEIVYGTDFEGAEWAFSNDIDALTRAYLAQDPPYADLTARLAAAESQLAEERVKVASLEAERDRLYEKSESASALCLAWDFVFQGIDAHIRDRIAVGDPASPETYLQIIRKDAGQVAVDSQRFLASRRSEIDQLHARISKLTKDGYNDATPLTAERVMELLPKTDDYEDHVSGRYGFVTWHWWGGKSFTLEVFGSAVRLSDFTIGTFRHLLAALRIGCAA